MLKRYLITPERLGDVHPALAFGDRGQFVYPEEVITLAKLDALTDAACTNADEALDQDKCWYAEDPTGTYGSYTVQGRTNSTNPLMTTSTFSPTVDLTGATLVFDFYVHPGTSGQTDYWDTYAQAIKIEIRSGGGGAYSTWNVWRGQTTSDWGHEGLFTIRLIPVSPDATSGGGVDLTAVDSIRIYFNQATGGDPDLTVDRIGYYYPSSPRGFYSLFLDSTFVYVRRAVAYLRTKGLTCQIGISPFLVGSTAAYLTWQELRDFQYLGFDIGLYTGDDPYTAWDAKSSTDKIGLIRRAMTLFRENGINPVGVHSLQLSGGNDWNLNDDQSFKQNYVATVMGENEYTNSPRRLTTLYDVSKLDWSLGIHSQSTPYAAVSTMIANAETYRAVIMAGSHMETAQHLTDFIGCVELLAASTLVHKKPLQLVRGDRTMIVDVTDPQSFLDFRVWDTVSSLLPASAADDDMGLITGTFGTSVPTVQGVDFGGGSTNEKCRFQYRMKDNYVAGASVSIRCHTGMLTTVSDQTAATTLDCEVYKSDREGAAAGTPTDLCTTAAQGINSLTLADKDFSLNPVGLAPGDLLDIVFTFAGTDTGNAGEMIPTVTQVEVIYRGVLI